MARLRREEEAMAASAQRGRLEQTVAVLQRELAAKREEAQAAQVGHRPLVSKALDSRS